VTRRPGDRDITTTTGGAVVARRCGDDESAMAFTAVALILTLSNRASIVAATGPALQLATLFETRTSLTKPFGFVLSASGMSL
jgi:hypothetical protein